MRVIRLMLNASLINTIPENEKFLFILYGSKSSKARQRECEGESCGIYIYACLGGAKPKLLSHIHSMHLTAQIVNLTWHFQAEIRNAPAFKLAPICK